MATQLVAQHEAAWVLLDYVFVVLYTAFVVGVCLWAQRSARKSHKTDSAEDSVESYFCAGQNVAWWALAASLFGSNVGTEHFVGLAGWGCKGGLAVALFEIAGIISLLVLAYVFLPMFWNNGIRTMPEYLERRYNSTIRSAMVIFSLFTYVLTKAGATLYGTQLIIEQVLRCSRSSAFLCVVGVTAFTIVYTLYGGLFSVIYTDVLQSSVLVIGGFLLLIVGWAEAAASGEIFWNNESIVRETPEFFHLLNSPSGNSDIPWTAFLCGYFILGIKYWCCDQVIVQRALAARNIVHGRVGCAAAGLLKLTPLFIMVIPGMIARFFMVRGDAFDVHGGLISFDNGNQAELCDQAYPFLINFLLNGTGLSGLMIAVIMSAMMSSLSSVFNSAATIFTLDIYSKVQPNASEREMVLVGRAVVVAVGVLSVAWLMVIPLLNESLFQYVQELSSYQAPSVLVLFVLGCFWAPANSSGALAALVIGHFLGVVKFISVICFKLGYMNQYPLLRNLAAFNFLYYSAINFIVSLLTHIAVSKWFRLRKEDIFANSLLLWQRNLFSSLLLRQQQQATFSGGGGDKNGAAKAAVDLSSGGGDDDVFDVRSGEATKTFRVEGPLRTNVVAVNQRQNWLRLLSNCASFGVVALGIAVFVAFM